MYLLINLVEGLVSLIDFTHAPYVKKWVLPQFHNHSREQDLANFKLWMNTATDMGKNLESPLNSQAFFFSWVKTLVIY